MQALVEYLAQSLVDDPKPVEVKEETTDDGTLYLVKVGKSDLGKLIGKKGRTVKAIRSLVSAASNKAKGSRCGVEIVEPDEEASDALAKEKPAKKAAKKK